MRDLLLGTTTRVTVGSDEQQGDGNSGSPAISADGRYVSFFYTFDDLVAGDTNGRPDIFVRDVLLGTTTRVSMASDGSEANNDSWESAISADGRFISFGSYASSLIAGDLNNAADVFVTDGLAQGWWFQ